MQAPSIAAVTHKLAILALLTLTTSGCQPNTEVQPAAPAVPTPVPADTAKKTVAQEPTMVSAGQERWIKLDELPWEQWYLQYVDDKRVGYTHLLVQRSAIEDNTQHVRITRTDCMEVDNNGTPARLKRTIQSIELASGQLVELSDTSQSLGTQSLTEGKRSRGKFTGTTRKTTAGEDEETSQIGFDWSDEAWGLMGLQAMMMQHVPAPGEHLQAEVFVPQLYKIAHAELLAGQFDLTALPGGQTQSLLAVDVAVRSEDNGMLSRNWINERGEVLKTVALSGPNLSSFWTPAEVAHRTRDEFNLADLIGTHVALVGAIPKANAQQVVYHVDRDAGASGEDVFTLLAKSSNQSKVSVDALSVEATVSRAQRESPDKAKETEAEPEKCYLQASRLIPADNASLVSLAQEWAGKGKPAKEKTASREAAADSAERNPDKLESDKALQTVTQQLTRRVHQEIALNPLGRSVDLPLQTLQKKSGDCVAHTLLLVSLLRAEKIPARAVSGLRIDPNDPTQMQFYVWTEAWLAGRWLPLDSTTGGLAAPDRLKFSDSCLTSDNPYDIILPTYRQMPGLQVRIKSSK